MPVKGPKETAIACAISATSLRAAVCVTWRVAAIVTSVDALHAVSNLRNLTILKLYLGETKVASIEVVSTET